METNALSHIKRESITYNHIVISSLSDADTANFTVHCHEGCELIFFLSGNVKYVAEGRTYKLTRGDVVVSRPSMMHMISPEKDAAYERYALIVDVRSLPSGLWARLKHGRDVYHCLTNEKIFELFSRLDYYFGKFPDDEYAQLVQNIAVEILFNLSLIEGEDEIVINSTLERALSYIRENLTRIKDIDEISRALYVTKSHLHHLFTKHLQITPAKYITSKRLLLAQKRIRRGEKPTAVFSECGFEDYATFFRNYKRYFGYSPIMEGRGEISREIVW